MRRVASSSEFFDILDKIGNGKFVTIGYVTGANLDVPTVSRRNPATNRMKKYLDYTVFGGEEEIGALVKITSYNMRYLNRTTVGQKYGEFKTSANDIRTNFGIDPIADKTSYKQGTNWSPNGPEIYNGQNADLQSHSYNPQNIFGVKPKGVVYAINKEGHIIKELSPEQVRPYLKAKREIDGVAALRKMGAEEERIQDYINQINNLKFKYINFESNSILWIAATINGEKIVYINDNLYRAVDGIDINPQDFRAIARERYQIDLNDLQEMTKKTMNKNIFRLTEGDLRKLVMESAQKILSELDWQTYASAAKKNDEWRQNNPHRANQWNRSMDFRSAARDAFDKKHGLEHQYDEPNSHYGGDKGSINLNTMDDFSVTGSRDHDFGDGDPHGLRHNVYHMGKKYGKDGGYGRTRMWDYAHETTPEEFYGNKEMGQKFRDAEQDAEDFNSGKSHYVSGKGWSNESNQPKQTIKEWDADEYEGRMTDMNDDRAYQEDLQARREKQIEDYYQDKYRRLVQKYPGKSREWYEAMVDIFENKNSKETIKEETFQNNQGYSHFAVNKATNKIVNGWDYSEYDPSELRQFKKDYFDVDMVDYGFNPKDYKIVTGKYLLRQGIDPNDNNNWANA